jgi:hypothetical protein
MSARSIRRAAERKAAKLARTAGSPIQASAVEQNPLATESTHSAENAEPTEKSFAAGANFGFSAPETPPMLPQQAPTGCPETISDARRAANRANAQSSTGPTSAAGKAKSSMNAVKTGLTGRTVLLPTDDATAYQQHLDRHFDEFTPATDKEKSLAQHIADSEWRLLRIAPLEAGIYAVGRRKLADLFPEEKDPYNRQALIDAEIFLTYRKDFSNLALQERRLRNQRNADIAQLETLQKDRRDKQTADLKRALALYKSTRKLGVAFEPAFFGFVFSLAELDDHINREQAAAFAQGQPSDFTKEQFDAYLTQWKERQAA